MLCAGYLLKLHILCWQDLLEIACLWGAILSLTLFLHKDKQSPLLGYFYGYSALFIASQIIHLSTLTVILLTYAPLCISICLLFHTTALQKNFVSYKTIAPKEYKPEWIEAVIRIGLHAFSNNKPLRIVIERTDHLLPFIQDHIQLDGSLTESFLHLFLQSKAQKNGTFLWITALGKIKGFNGILIPTPQHQDASEKQNSSVAWIHDALFITHKTDALMIEFNPQNRTASAIVKATLFKNLSIHEIHDLLYHYCSSSQKSLSKGENYASHHTTTSRSRHNTW